MFSGLCLFIEFFLFMFIGNTITSPPLNERVLRHGASHWWEDLKISMIAVLQQGAAAHQVRRLDVFFFGAVFAPLTAYWMFCF